MCVCVCMCVCDSVPCIYMLYSVSAKYLNVKYTYIAKRNFEKMLSFAACNA